jgi:hypothetical protein
MSASVCPSRADRHEEGHAFAASHRCIGMLAAKSLLIERGRARLLELPELGERANSVQRPPAPFSQPGASVT